MGEPADEAAGPVVCDEQRDLPLQRRHRFDAAPRDVGQALPDQDVRIDPHDRGQVGGLNSGALVELGAHPAGQQCRHLDPRALQLQGQPGGPGAGPGLDGGVVAREDRPRRGGDVDDPAPATRLHGPARSPAEDQHRQAHHVQGPFMALDQGGVEQRRVQPESCVVDQDIDRIGICLQARRDLQHLVTDGKVGGQHIHRDAMHLGQLGGGGLQAFPVPGDEHQVVSAGSQLLGEGVADAGGRSRDQCSCHGATLSPLAKWWKVHHRRRRDPTKPGDRACGFPCQRATSCAEMSQTGLSDKTVCWGPVVFISEWFF